MILIINIKWNFYKTRICTLKVLGLCVIVCVFLCKANIFTKCLVFPLLLYLCLNLFRNDWKEREEEVEEEGYRIARFISYTAIKSEHIDKYFL